MLKTPILAIFRGIELIHVESIVQSCINAGIDTVEITMNTNNAAKLIEEFIDCSKGKLIVGAGTVLTNKQLDVALDAGATFAVTPVVNMEVIQKCSKDGIPVFPGAFTPTEVWQAWDAGATMVKLFPSSVVGAEYIKMLKGPLDKIKIMAVGGVNANTIRSYFKNGADAVAIGGSIFSTDRLSNKEYVVIERELKDLISQIPL